jgi:general secretion pathway protein E
MLLQGASSGQIKEEARKNGMKTLFEDGLRLARVGITTLDEALRVTKDEGMTG